MDIKSNQFILPSKEATIESVSLSESINFVGWAPQSDRR